MAEPREQSHHGAPWEATTGRPGPAPGGPSAGGPDARRSAPEDWAAAFGAAHGDDAQCLEWCPICRSADVVRAAGGPDVRNQLASLQRDSLMALRTLIDAYLARAMPQQPPPEWDEPVARPGDPPGERPAQPAEPPVQDIPLD